MQRQWFATRRSVNLVLSQLISQPAKKPARSITPIVAPTGAHWFRINHLAKRSNSTKELAVAVRGLAVNRRPGQQRGKNRSNSFTMHVTIIGCTAIRAMAEVAYNWRDSFAMDSAANQIWQRQQNSNNVHASWAFSLNVTDAPWRSARHVPTVPV